jgi:hypothetical protein
LFFFQTDGVGGELQPSAFSNPPHVGTWATVFTPTIWDMSKCIPPETAMNCDNKA